MTDLKTLSIKDLKALAYDMLVQYETAQQNIKLINQEIALRQNETASKEV